MERKTNWWMVVAITSLVLLFFNRSGMMGFGGFGCGNYNGYGGMMSWMWGNPLGTILSFLVMIILSGLTIWIIVYFIRMVTDSLNQQKSSGGKNGKVKNR